jgi:uroporphyrinogen-III synthase
MQTKNNLPLAGVRVLVGRARHQAGALSAELRKLGATVLEIPFIEIRKPRSFKPLDSALRNLDSYDWLVLTSVNGVEAMWKRLEKLKLDFGRFREGHDPSASLRASFTRAANSSKEIPALAAEGLRIAAIGPATKKAIEQRGIKVNVMPKEYVAESVVRSLRMRVKGKRVLLVRAKVARDVIPNELRKAGAQVDVVEAYETVVPRSSRVRLRSALANPRQRPHVVTFTSSSTVRNFVALLGSREAAGKILPLRGRVARAHTSDAPPNSQRIKLASIGPVTSSTLRESGLPVDIKAKEFTIPGLVEAIVLAMAQASSSRVRR